MKTLLLLLLALPAAAEVVEIKSMKEIQPKLEPGTLVVFDIDNTLVEPVGNIGSDQWYYYLVKAVARDDAKLTPEQAEEKAAEIWTRTLGTVAVKPVEELTPAFIKHIQSRGLKTMALTARGREDVAATFAQLKAIGVDLAAKPVHGKDHEAADKGFYSRGVFFAGEGPDKGVALVRFLKAIGLAPKAVVFVDDKPHHARNVDAALTAAGIPVASFRYGAADAKVAAFNAVMGEADTAEKAELLFKGK